MSVGELDILEQLKITPTLENYAMVGLPKYSIKENNNDK